MVPQTPNDRYAWVAYGRVEISTSGDYDFCTKSDDGSYLYVDRKELVNNDGLHGAVDKCGTVALTKGAPALSPLPGRGRLSLSHLSMLHLHAR
eukprot:2642494-Rhodomonas_salina.1